MAVEDFDYYVAGWQEIGGSHHDVEHDPGSQPSDDDLVNADYVTVGVLTPEGDEYYVHLVGPFDDYGDLEDAVADWYVNGTP